MTKKLITKINSGLSLIEIMVTLAIVSLIMALGVSVVNDLTDSDLREAAFRLQGTIKYVYNEAAIKKKYFRIVFDLESQEYLVESKSDPFYIRSENNQEDDLDKKAAKSLLDQESILDQEMDENKQVEVPDEFTQVEDGMLKPKKLPSGVRIVDISISHLPDKVTNGKAELYFFPNGWVEKAFIHLGNDEEDNFYTLEVMPATGKVKINTGYQEAEIESIKENIQ